MYIQNLLCLSLIFIPIWSFTLDNEFSDWPSDCSFQTPVGVWYIAWENNDFLLGLNTSAINLQQQQYSIDIYFNTEPNEQYHGIKTFRGTKNVVVPNNLTQPEEIPFEADYCVIWEPTQSYALFEAQNNITWIPSSNFINITTSSPANTTVEIRIEGISSLVSDSGITNVWIRLMQVPEEISLIDLPSSNSWFTFPLVSNVPGSSFAGYVNSMPSVTQQSGLTNVSSTWLGNYQPSQSNSTAIIRHNSKVQHYFYCSHLAVMSGATLLEPGGFSIKPGYQPGVPVPYSPYSPYDVTFSQVFIQGVVSSYSMFIFSPARVIVSSNNSFVDVLRIPNQGTISNPIVEFTGDFALGVRRVEVDSSVSLKSGRNSEDIFDFTLGSELYYLIESPPYLVPRGDEWRQNSSGAPDSVSIYTPLHAAMDEESDLVANDIFVHSTFVVNGTCSNCSLYVQNFFLELDNTDRLYVYKNIYAYRVWSDSCSCVPEEYIECDAGATIFTEGEDGNYHTMEIFTFELLINDSFSMVFNSNSSNIFQFTDETEAIRIIIISSESIESSVKIENLEGTFSSIGSFICDLPAKNATYEISMLSGTTNCLMKSSLHVFRRLPSGKSNGTVSNLYLLLVLLTLIPAALLVGLIVWSVRRRKSKQKFDEVKAIELPKIETIEDDPFTISTQLSDDSLDYILVSRISNDVSTKPESSEEKHLALDSNRSETITWEITFDEIKIVKELGRGAFGVVYLSRWRNTECVVKRLDNATHDPRSVEQFLKEANNVRNLRKHPNICQVFGICTDPVAIVMEYYPEGSLDTLLYEGRIAVTPQMMLGFAKMIASGMCHLHAENLIHCDLACRNILVEQKRIDKFVLKIADFGLSRILQADEYKTTSNNQFPIRWTAPETLRSGKITRSSDVWSFAVILWEIAEAKRPYTDLSNSEVFAGVCDQDLRLPRPQKVWVIDDIWDLMMRCWLPPAQRPSFKTICTELDDIENKYFGNQNINNNYVATEENSKPVKTEPTSYESMAYCRRQSSE